MEPYLAAALQMTSGASVEQNLDQARELIAAAAKSGATLVGLPENFGFLGEDEQKSREAASIARSCEDFLASEARRFRLTLLGGGYPVPAEGGRVFNTATLIGPDGIELARYQKIHLFDVDLPDGQTFRESESVQPGSSLPPMIEAGVLGRLGLTICYDLRFPELYRHLSSLGADILLIPSAFTAVTGRDHWDVLLKARAIENTCYVLAPAQVGYHGNRQSHGHAMIVDPWGLTLADAGTEPGVATAEIDPRRLQEVRKRIPSLRHRVV